MDPVSGDYIWIARNSYRESDDSSDSSESSESDEVTLVWPSYVQVQGCCRLQRLINPSFEGDLGETQLWTRSVIESPPMEMSRGEDNPLLQREVSSGDTISIVEIVDGQASVARMETLTKKESGESGENGERVWNLYKDDSSSDSSIEILSVSSEPSSPPLSLEDMVIEIEIEIEIEIVTDSLQDDFDDVVLD